MGGGPVTPMDTMDLYRELAEAPTYSSATFLGQDTLNIHIITRSHLLKTRLKSTKTIPLSGSPSAVPSAELPAKSSEFWSSDRKLKGVLKTIGDKRYVEVWDWQAGRAVAAKEVTEDVGEFLDDETWGNPTFSPSTRSLVFSAHRLPPKEPSKDLLVRHRFTPIWGETYRTLISPTPFLFTWTSSPSAKPTVRPIVSRDIDPAISFAQTQFVNIEGKESLVATGYETMEDGRRYGIVYCANRRAGLWLIPCPSTNESEEGAALEDLIRLSDPERSARSPRLLSRGEGKPDILVYLTNPLGGAHNSCASLHGREVTGKSDKWTSSTSDVVVESVWSPSPTEFPGLYLNSLPTRPFLDLPHLGPHVVLSSTYHSRGTIYTVPLKLGKTVVPTELTTEKEAGEQPTWTMLGTDGGRRIVAVQEGLIAMKGVRVGQVSGEGAEAKVRWSEVLETGRLTEQAASTVASLRPSLLSTPDLGFPVQTLLLSPAPSHSTSSSPPPLILVPHGGPHSTTITSFSPSYLALAAAGFAIALVNYSGSLGFGEKAVQSLIGQCGTLDVADCLGVVEQWKKTWAGRMKEEDWKGKLFVSGGSHGGFLTAHLTSRFPDLFTAAILRNPVTSFGENCTITDIPDWCFGEMGFSFPFSPSQHPRPSISPTPEQFALMQAASPITNVRKVKAATLILMGEEDRRVPPSQTKAWYHSLKSRAAEIKHLNATSQADKSTPELDVECLVFPGEGHALDGVEAEVVGFEAGLDWFRDRSKF